MSIFTITVCFYRFSFQSDEEGSGSEATEISERSQHFIAHVPVPSQKEVCTLGPADYE